MAWQRYKNIADKYFKNKKFNEGDVVLYKTVDGRWKKTVLKKTIQGTLFLEAAEIKNKEFIIVKIKEIPKEDIIYVPTYKELCLKANFDIYDEERLLSKLEEK